MQILNSISEEHDPITTLQVTHRRLRIPYDSYLNSVKEFTDPWNELAYQHAVQNYLNDINDTGIIGMVRQEHDTQFVFLDAAVRYPVQSE